MLHRNVQFYERIALSYAKGQRIRILRIYYYYIIIIIIIIIIVIIIIVIIIVIIFIFIYSTYTIKRNLYKNILYINFEILFHSNANYSNIIIRFVSFWICFYLTNILYNFHSFYNSTKYSMFIIQPRLKQI